MHQQDSYLLQNQLNPFPVPGVLTIDDDGTLSFTLNGKSSGAALGWLEKVMGREDLKEVLQGGQELKAFSLPIAGVEVKWPKTLGGYAMKFEDGERSWIVSLNQPSGGALWQTINMIQAGKTSKPWKAALVAAGAK